MMLCSEIAHAERKIKSFSPSETALSCNCAELDLYAMGEAMLRYTEQSMKVELELTGWRPFLPTGALSGESDAELARRLQQDMVRCPPNLTSGWVFPRVYQRLIFFVKRIIAGEGE